MGGSFDPAHKGHLIISKIALKKVRLKKIYWTITKKRNFRNYRWNKNYSKYKINVTYNEVSL